MGESKPLFQSRTILFNVMLALAWVIGLVVEAAEAADVPEAFSEYALLIAAVGNVVLRIVTTVPVELPSFRLPGGD